MECLRVAAREGTATVTMSRGTANALSSAMLQEMAECLGRLAADPGVHSVVLTGEGKFFCFGFDIEELLSCPREALLDYVAKYCRLASTLFLYPKPLVAAINGHAVGGGCVLALVCDRRWMVAGRAKIGFNELRLGSSLLAPSVEVLRYVVGSRNAESILLGAELYQADEARELGLVDQACAGDELYLKAWRECSDLGQRDPHAFRHLKTSLRGNVAAEMARSHRATVAGWADVWYSADTRARLEGIVTSR